MKIKLVDGSIYPVSRAEITNGRLEIDFREKSSEEIQEIFTDPGNLTIISLLTGNDEKFGEMPGWTVYGGVMLVGDTKTLILSQQTDPVQERLDKVETKVLEARMLAEDLKENGIPFEQNTVLNASVMVARVNAQALNDVDALEVKAIYNTWEELVSKGFMASGAGYKFTYNGNLYKTVHDSQRFTEEWIPGQGTESIFVRIEETHAGTLEDPIPAAVNMEYTKGLYYLEDDTVYLMNREGMANGESTVLQFMPSALLNQYFVVILKE